MWAATTKAKSESVLLLPRASSHDMLHSPFVGLLEIGRPDTSSSLHLAGPEGLILHRRKSAPVESIGAVNMKEVSRELE